MGSFVTDGHFLLAVSSGDPSMPIQCYKVTVKKEDEKCIIKSQSLLSFFLLEAPKEALSKFWLHNSTTKSNHRRLIPTKSVKYDYKFFNSINGFQEFLTNVNKWTHQAVRVVSMVRGILNDQSTAGNFEI